MSGLGIKHLYPFHEGPKGTGCGELIKYEFTPNKNYRRELWVRGSITEEWRLFDANPGREWRESFMGPAQFVPAIIGLFFDKTWSTNGNPAPAAGNFVAANELGGGLTLRDIGAVLNHWVAIHTGANYPVDITLSPHFFITGELVTITEVRVLGGLVGAANLETLNNNPFTMPDDGIFLSYDTNVDANVRFVTRANGVSTETILGVFPPGHHERYVKVNDAGTSVSLIVDGVLVATHTTHLPTVQLKPYFMIGNRVAAGAQRDVHLHDYHLIYDA